MKTFIKENWFKLLIVGALIFIVFVRDSRGSIENPFKDSYTSVVPLSSDIIVCRFDYVADFFESENNQDLSTAKIDYKIGKQKNPITLTFANLSGQNPSMKGNAGEVPLTILKNNDEMMLLAEESAFGDLFLYTIFKKQKVATWQKSYLLINSPYAMVSMGYCN